MNATSKTYARSVHCNAPTPGGNNFVLLLPDRAAVRSQLVTDI